VNIFLGEIMNTSSCRKAGFDFVRHDYLMKGLKKIMTVLEPGLAFI
jgi:hypothetical protein